MGGGTGAREAAGGQVRTSFLGLLAVWFVNGCLSAPLTTQLPVYVDSVLHGRPIFTATLQTVQMGCGAIAAILGGVLADMIGVKRTLLAGLAGAIVLSLQFYSSAPVLLLLIAVVGGAAFGCQSVGSQAYLLAALGGRRLGIAAAAFFLGNTFGSALGNYVAGRALDRVGFGPVAGAILVGSCLLVLATAMFLPPTAPPGRAQPIRLVLTGYGRLLRRPDVRLLCGVRYLTTCYWGAVTLLLPLLAYRLTGSRAAAGTYAAVSLAVAACCTIIIGRLSDRVGRRRPALALTALIIVDSLLLARFSNSYPGLFAAGVAGSAAAWSLSTLMPGLIDEVSGTSEKGRAVGLLHAVWSGAMLSGSLVGGALVGLAAPLPFLVVGLGNVGSLALMVVLLGHRPRSPAPALVVSPDTSGEQTTRGTGDHQGHQTIRD